MDKDDPRFDVVLQLNDPNFGEKLIKAIDLAPGEKLEITTPQFNRIDSRTITYIPKTKEEYAAIALLEKEGRKAVGMCSWGEEKGKTLWLFPAEWYEAIPEGLKVTDILGDEEIFKPGKTDKDRRYGCLAYGFAYEVEKR